jgi:putative ABC transport system permease protein
MGHNYEYDSRFKEYHTEPVSMDAMAYLDCQTTLSLRDQEVTQTIVGIYNLNSIYELQDEKGIPLSVPGRNSIYINPGLAEIYGVAIGDVLTITILGSSHDFAVTKIAENAKSESIIMNAEELSEILNLPSGSYNGLLSMDKVAGCEETITRDQRIEKLNRNAVSNKISGVINQVIGCVVGAILIFLALLINFQDNTRDILILNIMGYRIKAIKKLLVDVYLPIVLVCFVLTILPSISMVKSIQRSLSISTNDYMPFGTNILVIFMVFLFLNIIYWIVKSISMLGVKHIIAKEEISEYT